MQKPIRSEPQSVKQNAKMPKMQKCKKCKSRRGGSRKLEIPEIELSLEACAFFDCYFVCLLLFCFCIFACCFLCFFLVVRLAPIGFCIFRTAIPHQRDPTRHEPKHKNATPTLKANTKTQSCWKAKTQKNTYSSKMQTANIQKVQTQICQTPLTIKLGNPAGTCRDSHTVIRNVKARLGRKGQVFCLHLGWLIVNACARRPTDRKGGKRVCGKGLKKGVGVGGLTPVLAGGCRGAGCKGFRCARGVAGGGGVPGGPRESHRGSWMTVIGGSQKKLTWIGAADRRDAPQHRFAAAPSHRGGVPRLG